MYIHTDVHILLHRGAGPANLHCDSHGGLPEGVPQFRIMGTTHMPPYACSSSLQSPTAMQLVHAMTYRMVYRAMPAWALQLLQVLLLQRPSSLQVPLRLTHQAHHLNHLCHHLPWPWLLVLPFLWPFFWLTLGLGAFFCSRSSPLCTLSALDCEVGHIRFKFSAILPGADSHPTRPTQKHLPFLRLPFASPHCFNLPPAGINADKWSAVGVFWSLACMHVQQLPIYEGCTGCQWGLPP